MKPSYFKKFSPEYQQQEMERHLVELKALEMNDLQLIMLGVSTLLAAINANTPYALALQRLLLERVALEDDQTT